jgi:hypothetical protein
VVQDPKPKSKTPHPTHKKGAQFVGIMRKGRRMKLPAMAMRTSNFRDEG